MTPAEESALIAKYRPLVRTVAWSVSPEAARDEDALQSGLIGLWEAARRWDGRRPFEPLARRCIRCNILDCLGCGYEHSCGVHGCAVLRRCKELTLERTLAERKVRLSVLPASPVWHVAMLVRVERWWPGWYASKYCASVEEVDRYLQENAWR